MHFMIKLIFFNIQQAAYEIRVLNDNGIMKILLKYEATSVISNSKNCQLKICEFRYVHPENNSSWELSFLTRNKWSKRKFVGKYLINISTPLQ